MGIQPTENVIKNASFKNGKKSHLTKGEILGPFFWSLFWDLFFGPVFFVTFFLDHPVYRVGRKKKPNLRALVILPQNEIGFFFATHFVGFFLRPIPGLLCAECESCTFDVKGMYLYYSVFFWVFFLRPTLWGFFYDPP